MRYSYSVNPTPRIRKTVKWSGVLTCALAALWVGSWFGYVQRNFADGWWAAIASGYVIVEKMDAQSVLPGEIGWRYGTGRMGIVWLPSAALFKGRSWILMPVWVPLILVLALTIAAWRRDHRAVTRARLNHCPTCNYDRRGLPVTSPCPECGAVTAATPDTLGLNPWISLQ
jgi:hypothetical protein